MPYASCIPLLTLSDAVKPIWRSSTSRDFVWQHWLLLHMAVCIASSKHRLDASLSSRRGRERERENMHNPLLGYLVYVFVCVRVCVCLRERNGACMCSYINPQWHARQQQKLSQRTAVAATASKPPGSGKTENTHTHTHTHTHTQAHTLSIPSAL